MISSRITISIPPDILSFKYHDEIDRLLKGQVDHCLKGLLLKKLLGGEMEEIGLAFPSYRLEYSQ
ncbi:hypothetical protein JOC74_002560 [Bacillus capparidis]|uniref:Uncharacterized protein n=1 Tax=Bacillus capparidis TaxID=1840411 RepID=A0ABS4CWV0_9BACI|nr:hypothetical protein [Bacillus capparidis]